MRTSATAAGPDEAAFGEVFERTSARVYGYVRRHCDDDDCDDVVSEVFLVAWRRFTELPPDPVPWLLATARRVLANHWRGKGRRAALDAELRAVRQLAEPDPPGLATERAVMLAALARVSADDRELLLLIGWDGLDVSGAAQVLGCSPTAARARLSRARRRLEAAFDDASLESSAAPSGALLLSEGN